MSEEPRLEPLSNSRGVTADEMTVLRRILELHGGPRPVSDELRVVSECNCGCSSVGLDDRVPRSAQGHEAWRATDGSLELILHELDGRLVELEVWSGQPGPAALPNAEDLEAQS